MLYTGCYFCLGSIEMQLVLPKINHSRWRDRIFPNGEWILLMALVVEAAVFSTIADNFLTWANLFELVRVSAELGLIAIALTPVIITGGIDLSMGSMMGLAAVLFGA